MNINFPVIELLDRLAIAEVKYDKTRANHAELDYYRKQAQILDLGKVNHSLEALKQIHREIWDLEKELKSGVEHQLPLEEIGLRAIQIRDHNNKRIAIKNIMADALGCEIREIKKDHLSE